MPFVSPTQYIESADEFIAHWAQVNAALGASPLLRATLTAVCTALKTAITALSPTP